MRHPMMCCSEYHTIGKSVMDPVKMPLTIKNGIRQTKKESAKSPYQDFLNVKSVNRKATEVAEMV
jgi:hypothetical protein